MSEQIPHISELPEWPVFDTPYRVTDAFGDFVEIIQSGATAHAKPLAGRPWSMVVGECVWSDDFTRRTIHRIAAISGPEARATLHHGPESRQPSGTLSDDQT